MKGPGIRLTLRTLGSILLTLGLLTGPVWADTGTRPQGKRHLLRGKHRVPLRVRLEKLNLSAEQKKKLLEHRAEFRKKMADFKARIQLKKVDLENEMDKPQPDPKKVEKLTQEIKDLMKERRDARAKANAEVENDILTPAQLEQWKKMEKEKD